MAPMRGIVEVPSSSKLTPGGTGCPEEDVLLVYREARIRVVRITPTAAPSSAGPSARNAWSSESSTAAPPRSPALSAFVERFQETCLHLHYRTAFRTATTRSTRDIAPVMRPRSATTTSSDRTAAIGPLDAVGRRPAELFHPDRPSLLKLKEGTSMNSSSSRKLPTGT